MLKKVLFPTLGKPTMPIFKLVPKRPIMGLLDFKDAHSQLSSDRMPQIISDEIELNIEKIVFEHLIFIRIATYSNIDLTALIEFKNLNSKIDRIRMGGDLSTHQPLSGYIAAIVYDLLLGFLDSMDKLINISGIFSQNNVKKNSDDSVLKCTLKNIEECIMIKGEKITNLEKDENLKQLVTKFSSVCLAKMDLKDISLKKHLHLWAKFSPLCANRESCMIVVFRKKYVEPIPPNSKKLIFDQKSRKNKDFFFLDLDLNRGNVVFEFWKKLLLGRITVSWLEFIDKYSKYENKNAMIAVTIVDKARNKINFLRDSQIFRNWADKTRYTNSNPSLTYIFSN
ncbi:hypothetical protein BpHYR1_043991 [Brachionus plicatilis]|uniref:Uncharacterized protein n=1 Tax=Brachionus plicatilis TaxID=10195 RepID=A0A3M7QU58_BRAPC|nr:hypothetical protein BpHYR1_043991 [Brachionus plicatilis]